jgi:Holliday junction resolvase|tara:strand:- start:118 stop:525 length:408 start_codon:yes stop_codon:yes gene_type:complete
MEKNLWKSLNKIAKTRSLFMMRLETTTINGVPDVFCCIKGKSFFVELKANDDKKLNLSKYQILWQIDYLKAGGNVFNLVLALSQRELKLVKIVPSLYSFCSGYVPEVERFDIIGSKKYTLENLDSIINLATDSCH